MHCWKLLVFCVTVSCSAKQVTATEPTPAEVDSTKHEYPAEVARNFLQSCEEKAGNTKACSCLLDRFQRKYTFEEFTKMETFMSIGKVDSDSELVAFLTKIKSECRNP